MSGLLKLPTRNLVTRAAQTEPFALQLDGATVEKAYFRIVHGEQVLQFRLPMTTAFVVMFAKIPVKGDFMWHGIALDESLTPLHYNMLPGEEHCATLHIAQNHRAAHTHAESLLIADATRALGFRLRLAEESNDALRREIDDLHAQVYALHRELANVNDLAARRIEEERARCDAATEERCTIEANLRRLEAEHDMLRRQGMRRAAGAFEATSPALLGSAAAPAVVSPSRSTEYVAAALTPVASAAKPAAAMAQLRSDLRVWQSSVASTPQLDDRSGGAAAAARAVSPTSSTASSNVIRVAAVYMDESTQQEVPLAPLVVAAPHTVAAALQLLARRNPEAVPPVRQCMVCVRSAATGECVVLDIQQPGVLGSALCDGDTLYVAKMEPL